MVTHAEGVVRVCSIVMHTGTVAVLHVCSKQEALQSKPRKGAKVREGDCLLCALMNWVGLLSDP